jgi:large subunit ribosomal protein L22
MKAFLKDYRQSPRKVRLVADLVRGKRIGAALTALQFVNKKASDAIEKLIRSAQANAVSQGKNAETLVIKSIVVDAGTMSRRFKPRARGVAAPISRRNSHITIVLDERSQIKKEKGKAKKSDVAQSATQ